MAWSCDLVCAVMPEKQKLRLRAVAMVTNIMEYGLPVKFRMNKELFWYALMDHGQTGKNEVFAGTCND